MSVHLPPVRIPADLKKALQELARKQDRSMSSLVRQALRHATGEVR